MESCKGARMRAAHGRPTADRKVDPQNHSVAGLVGLSFLYFLTVADPRDTHEIPTNRPTESLYCIIIVSKLVQAFSHERPRKNGENRRHRRKLLDRVIFFLSAENEMKPSQATSC